MAITECENGHLYDNAIHNACPYCNGGIYRVDFGGDSNDQIGATVLLEEEPAGFSDVGEHDPDIGKTVLLDEESAGSPRLSPGGSEDIGRTVLLDAESTESPQLTNIDKADIGMALLLEEEVSFSGRLVCTEGPDKGKTIILEPGETVDISGGRYVYLS